MFVRPKIFEAAFDILTNLMKDICNNEVDDLLNYFENTYIGQFLIDDSRRARLFAINNIYHNIKYVQY